MKKIIFFLAVCAFGFCTQIASAQYVVKPTFMETQGVSNAGVVSGYVDQAGPYSLWNPDADTTIVIGGAAPGNGIGGAVRPSGDGNLYSGNTYQTIVTPTEWEKLNTGFNYIFRGIEFPGTQNSTGYAAGESLTYNGDGIVIKTLDGGDTWTELWTGEDLGLEAMSFPTTSTGYVGGWNEYFAKTTDGGTTWTTLAPIPDVYIYTSIEFKDGYNGVVAAQTNSDVAVYITSDGGTTWTAGSGLTGVPYHVTFVEGSTYFLVTNGGDIQKSTDNGLTWTTVYSSGGLMLGISFYDSMNGIATAENDIYRTTDGGVTWVGQEIQEGALWRDVAWQSADNVTLVGTPELIFSSEDGGATWPNNNMATSTLNEALYDVDFTDDGTGYIIGSQGVMFRKQTGVSTHTIMSEYNVSEDEWTVLGSFDYAVDISLSDGYNISEDGTTVVGLANVAPTPGTTGTLVHAAAWTEATGLIDLGSLYSDINRSTRANDVSADGSVIVGWQDFNGPWKSAVWRKDDNGNYLPNQFLLVDPAVDSTDQSNQLGQCTAVSADGNWIGGKGDFANNNEPYIWSEATGYISLGTLAAGATGTVMSINHDGSVVVGFFKIDPFTPNIPFIWTANGGLQNLNDFITGTLDMTMEIGPIWNANDISSNGKYITGWGFDPTIGWFGGETFSFRLELPTAPTNDVVANADAMSCGDLVANSTIFATNTIGNSSPDVYYSYTGNGEPEMITVSACSPETNFPTTVRVYSDNTLTDQIGFNDSSCENQPNLSFDSDGTNTYFIVVEGYDGSNSGNFQLTLTCENTTGVKESHLVDVGLYPNPVTNTLNISSQTMITTVTIYNIKGQVLMNKELNNTQGEIDLSSLASGLYFAKVMADNSAETFKIIKD